MRTWHDWGVLSFALLSNFYQNGKKIVHFWKKYDYHYQKTVYILSFPMCSLLLILFQSCARRRFFHFPPARWSKHALNFIHVEASDVSPLLFCVRDFGSFYFLPRPLRRRIILLGRKACEQNTVCKPQPTKCWVSFLIISQSFCCSRLFVFGIIWDL